MGSQSKKETLRKANKDVLRYQHEVQAEVDPGVKTEYMERLERCESNIDQLTDEKNTRNPIKYVRDRVRDDLKTRIDNAATELKDEYSKYLTKSEEAKGRRQLGGGGFVLHNAPLVSQQQFSTLGGGYGQTSGPHGCYAAPDGAYTQLGPLSRIGIPQQSSLQSYHETNVRYPREQNNNHSAQGSIAPNLYAPGPSDHQTNQSSYQYTLPGHHRTQMNYQHPQPVVYYANPYAGTGPTPAVAPYSDPYADRGHEGNSNEYPPRPQGY